MTGARIGARSFMETESLKLLLIGKDERFARGVADLLREGGGAGEPATAPTVNAGLAQLRENAFDAALSELSRRGQ